MCISACGKFGAATPDSNCQTFLTGECLKSTELTYYEPNSADQMCAGDRYRFIFPLDLDYSSESTDDVDLKLNWRHVPTQKTYDTFGENGVSVKKAYEDEFESFTRLYYEKHPEYFRRYSVVTILYYGGISQVADKEFAGVPAGKDLSEIICPDPPTKASGRAYSFLVICGPIFSFSTSDVALKNAS